MPYGAYDRFALHSGMADAGLGSAIALEAAARDKFVFTVLEPMVVMGFRILATVAFNYDTMVTATKVALDHRPAYGADTNRAELGVATLPQGLAAGKFIYKNITPKKVLPGEQLVIETKVMGVGGTETGDWLPVIIVAPAPETPGNCANMVESA